MAIGFWLLVALIIMLCGTLLATTSVGYRVILLSCLMIGLTPLGFIAGPGVPIYLPELLLVALAAGVVVKCYKHLPSTRLSGFLLLFAAFFALQIVAAMVRGEVTVFDLVRDIRPMAFVGLLLLLVDILRQASISRLVAEKTIAAAVVICIAADIVFYAGGNYGVLQIGGISGEYFARTGLVRYSDLMTISLFGLANYFLFSSAGPSRAFFWLMITGIIAALSLNRIFAIGFLIGFSWWFSMGVRQWTKLPLLANLAGLLPITGLVIAGILFTRSQPAAGEVVSRVTELFDLELLIAGLKYRFVDPALAGGYELTPMTFFIGEGMGLKFYVPWFVYRGLDPWHFSVDSLFAFAFFKYGLLGLMVLCYAISRLVWNRPWDLSNAWIWLYLLVHSGVNVPGFLMFLIVLTVLRDGSWILAWGQSKQSQGVHVSLPVQT